MNELIDKIEKLEAELDKLDSVQEIRKLNREIAKDKELVSLLDEYHQTPTEEFKRKIINNELFQKYKSQETEINLLILGINKKLKEINTESKCCK